MTKLINIIGQKFNRLTVLKYLGKSLWLCKCDCGNETVSIGKELKNGHKKSCGCLKRETSAKLAKKLGKIYGKVNIKNRSKETIQKIIFANKKYKNIEYDKTFYRLRNIYKRMIKFCEDENNKRYGGRGIKVCDEWKNNFLSFYNWAINNKFDANKEWFNCTIDRINNDGNYEPNNCRFANNLIQSRNRSTNHLITWNNKTYCISEWEQITGLPIRNRLKLGWSIEKTMTTPKNINKARYKFSAEFGK